MDALQFQLRLLDVIEKSKLSAAEISEMLRINPLAVEQWIDGESFPHPNLRLEIIKTLEALCVTE